MAFPFRQGESLGALPSGLDDSVDLNQFDEGYVNVSEEVFFPNAIAEEDMTNEWNVNQNPDPEENPASNSLSGGASSEDIIYNQLSPNELHTATPPPSVDPSYSSGFVEDLCRSVKQVDEAFLASAAMQFSSQQPLFNPIKDKSACASKAAKDNEQETEQARQEELLMDEDVPLNYQAVHPHEIELIEAEEIQKFAGSAFDGQDGNAKTHDDWQYDLSNEERAFMFDNDQDDKDFSSWLLYGSDDDDVAVFKSTLSEIASGDKPRTTVNTRKKRSLLAKPTTHLHDGKISKEHTVPGSGSQANKASSGEKSKSDVAKDLEKEPEHQSNTKPLSNSDPKHCDSSHDPPGRQSPLLDNNSTPESGFSFQNAIVCTSTPNNSARQSMLVDKKAAIGGVSPIKDIKQSKYFLRENRNA